ncbi:DUF2851 family protein [Rhodothermus profundi]|uniref:DUF2851 domain-containing protein n=1 Tax=Rhodothermus profundi TaxID=633813 RepID=A0A1M6PFW8_9BACT|nr:DUF2851 family protein [Rhodothermus profundi]SHK06814.1 Protein of unknown function [Rhodothermus profundi]
MRRRPPEALLHDLWAQGLLVGKQLRTVTGETVQIFHPGQANAEAGPDFVNACLLIDGTRWYGTVEVHSYSSDWTAHGHHQDPRYNSVILHVVLESDSATGRLQRADGSRLPELILAPYLPQSLRTLLYTFYRRPRLPLPCALQWEAVPASLRTSWVDALSQERLRQRARRIRARLAETAPDQLLYELLLTALGYAPNADPMRLLAQRLPLATVRTLPTLEDIEAALLGTAGLLETLQPGSLFTAAQCDALRNRFAKLQPQLRVPPLPALLWQRGKLRPANQPERRLVQAATWLAPAGWLRQHPIKQLQEALRHARPLTALRHLLCPDNARAPLGRQRTNVLLMNAIFPFMLALDLSDASQLHALLHLLPAERDQITRRFAQLGYVPPDAFYSQGLHQLYRAYCQPFRCLKCAIGRYLMGFTS